MLFFSVSLVYVCVYIGVPFAHKHVSFPFCHCLHLTIPPFCYIYMYISALFLLISYAILTIIANNQHHSYSLLLALNDLPFPISLPSLSLPTVLYRCDWFRVQKGELSDRKIPQLHPHTSVRIERSLQNKKVRVTSCPPLVEESFLHLIHILISLLQ